MFTTLYLKWYMTTAFGLYMFMMFIEKLYTFQEAYTLHLNKVVDEKWLLEQCRDAEFYSNMRQHTDLCEMVHRNSRRSAFLTALNAIAEKTYLCGSQSCTSLAGSMVSHLGWHVMGVIAFVLLLAPNLIFLAMRTGHHAAQQLQYQRRDLAFIDMNYEDVDSTPHRHLKRRHTQHHAIALA